MRGGRASRLRQSPASPRPLPVPRRRSPVTSSMISLLDIIGPVMVGPSSSHTAGACRIGLFARGLLDGPPETAKVELHGSFARTGVGHGTDRAIAGGLLGFFPDDERLRESLELAEKAGLAISFSNTKLRGEHHPNTARITLGRGGQQAVVTGSSIGAGRVLITVTNAGAVDESALREMDTHGIARPQPGSIHLLHADAGTLQRQLTAMLQM